MNTSAAVAAAFLLVLCAATPAATPAPELQKRVRAATFEVVVPKPPDGAVTYERPLPLELLPFIERNDRYWPVGTAFAIAPRTFVSAAHVLGAALGGAGGAPALRAANGEILQIDAVLRYSMHQDFVVFTTAATGAAATLETNTSMVLDERVFAVGNALGEGVVIRDGLATSLTPEDQDGRWKWLRYSAATSPGNSGGPLLDAAGKVIGVVIGKSQGENLNYALPIEHVLSAPGEARIDTRFPIRLPILRDPIVAKYDVTIPLPLAVAEFDRRLKESILEMYRDQRLKLLAKNAAEVFPNGRADKLLATVSPAYCPMLIVQGEDRTWELDENSRDNTDLPDEGNVCLRTSGGVAMFSIERGTASADPRFHADTRAAMDLLLKGVKLSRSVGSESVLVSSLGAAVRNGEHRDRFQRRWRLSVFQVPYVDSHLVALFLPTPNGYAGMLQFAGRGAIEATVEQLTFITDYFYVSYSGTLPQWKVFLARAEPRPPGLEGLSMERDASGLRYRSHRVDFDLSPMLMKMTDASTMKLQMSYTLEAGKLTWGVGAVYVSEDKDDKSYVGLIRQPKPASAAGRELTERWNSMLDGTGDFVNERGHDADYKKLWRRAAIGVAYRPGASVDRASNLLYEVVSATYHAKLPRQIDDMQERLLENLRVKER